MERIHKIYQSIRYPLYYTNVVIGDEIVRIGFEGTVAIGSYRVNGKYATSDPKIQKALEDSPSFNVEYRLINQRSLGEISEENTPAVNEDQNPVIDNKSQSDPNPQVDYKIIPEIKTVQYARDWLVKNIPEVSTRMVRNRDQVLKVAKEYKVQFPNLKQ